VTRGTAGIWREAAAELGYVAKVGKFPNAGNITGLLEAMARGEVTGTAFENAFTTVRERRSQLPMFPDLDEKPGTR